jgi:predicted ATPase
MSAEEALDNIRHMIEQMDEDRQSALAQYNAIRDLIIRILQHSGIKVGRLSLGDAAETINSDALSAGEKQMLSFLCYNAFYREAVIFIDEPELSLHVDWQRQLFPTLFNQRKSNQFIIATHSPFIYSKYPDKEIQLADDRGDNRERSRKRVGTGDGE